MLEPTTPAEEIQRIEELCALRLLDTLPEERFDRLTRLAKRMFGVKTALVSLVDVERQWFKSAQGLDATETPRSISFCGHAILSDQPFVIEDASADPRFADNPLVTGPLHLRFYAGVPLHGPNGYRVGTICIIDPSPRNFSEEDAKTLIDIGILIEEEFNSVQISRLMLEARSHEIRLQAILDHVVDGIITIDEAGTVETFNPAAVKIFGYASPEVVGRNIKMLMPQPYHGEHDGYLKNYQATGTAKIIGSGREVVGRRKDGSTFPLELAVSMMILNERRVFSGIVRDISERKRIEQLKSEFISTVSHELRTPLTSIRGSLGLVTGGVLGAIPERPLAMIEIAKNNCERLVRLINDILDIEKIESGNMRFDMVVQPLLPLVQQAIEATRDYALQYQVQFILHPELDDVVVTMDADRMTQVIVNLLSNAAKFSPSDGTVDVRIASGSIAGTVRISVTDQGTGIPEEFKRKIFQKFAQADSSDTKQKGGTGLGLSICKAMVEKHQGRIDFVSGTGRGTTFYFEMPIAIT